MTSNGATILLSWLCFLIPAILFVVAGILLHRHARRKLNAWAATQGYDVIRIQNPPFFRPGPFFLRNGRGWGIAQLVVRTPDDDERIGWVRYPAGIPPLSAVDFGRIELIWDDEWDRNKPLF